MISGGTEASPAKDLPSEVHNDEFMLTGNITTKHNKLFYTDPAQFKRLLELIPSEIMDKVWFIPLGKGVKDPDVPEGAKLIDPKYRLSAEQALERLKEGLNVGIYAIPNGLLFLDVDTDKGKIVLPLEIRRNIPATSTIKTRNGGLQYYYINNGTFKNKIHKHNGRKAGEVRANNYYVVAPGSYVEPDEHAGQDATGLYTIINDAPIVTLEALPGGIVVSEDKPKEEIKIENKGTWKNDLGMPLYEIRKKSPKLDTLLKGAKEADRSAADMATCQHLYFWKFTDAEIAGILQEYRPYEKTTRQDYLETTISKIIPGERYDPEYKSNGNGKEAPQFEYEPEPLKEEIELFQERRLKIDLPEDHFISQYVKWGKSVTDAYEEYHIANALWLLSAATNRKVVLKLRQEYIRPNLWIMTLGNSTTSRKSTAVNKARKIFESATNMSLPNEDFSLEGYLETLASQPIMHNVRDEASGLLEKFHQRYNDGILAFECTIYDGSPEKIQKRLSSGKAKEPKTYTISDYYVTKLYATTPDKLATCMTVSDFQCGYGYRWIYNYPKYKHERMPLEMEEAEDIKSWSIILTRLKEFYTIFQKKEDIEFKASKETMQYYDMICIEMERKAEEQNSDILNSVIGRAQIHILKIAMLLELGKHIVSTTLTEESIKNAAQMVTDYFIPSIMESIDRIQEDAKNNLIEKITAILRRLGGYATHTKLLRDSHLKSREFIECITTMCESQQIKIECDKPRSYRLINHNTGLDLRSVRKVRSVRTYTESNNDDANFAKMIDIDTNIHTSHVTAKHGIKDSMRTCEPCEHCEPCENVFFSGDEKVKQFFHEFYSHMNKPETMTEAFFRLNQMVLKYETDFKKTHEYSNQICKDYFMLRSWPIPIQQVTA